MLPQPCLNRLQYLSRLFGSALGKEIIIEVLPQFTELFEADLLEDVQYRLYVLQKIERGLKDVDEGRVYTQDEVEKMMAKWLEK